jgi:ribose transport system substrate-binding protein
MRIMKALGLGIVLGIALVACSGGDSKPAQTTEPGTTEKAAPAEKQNIELAYVTNGIDPFWNIAAAGVEQGAKDFGVNCQVLMPPKGVVDQVRMIEAALVNGVDGIAISPIDAANQADFINKIAEETNVITQDSDAPDSNRICFVGMDNYKAGRAAGKLVKEAIPDGGKVMIFVGRLEQLNSQQRRQGVVDELLDRPEQTLGNLKVDASDAVLKGDKYEIVDTRTDNFDYAKAKSNAEDAITSIPDLACMVGLFAYNIPNCLSAVEGAGKVGQIKLVSFDEAADTLQGIIDGKVYGTVSQQPYKYGYESVRILTGLAKGDKSVLPENDFLEVPIVVVRNDNVEAFWTELKRLRGES